jgi:hypothetical protein
MYTLRCAKCGKQIVTTKIPSVVVALPPFCNEHKADVLEEVRGNHSMWPHDWYGHAVRNDRLGHTLWKIDCTDA